MKELLKEWNKYLKEDKEIKDYADVPGMTAKLEEPKVVKFTYDAKPDKYAASREWLKKASEEFFSGVEEDLKDPYGFPGRPLGDEDDDYPKLEDPGPHDMLPSMSSRDFDEAKRAAEMDAFLGYNDFGQMSYTEKAVAQHRELVKYLHPGSQQYQDTKYYIDKYTPIAKEEKARRLLYLKEDKEIKDYADVPGLTATLEEPKVVKFAYGAKPDKYAASRKWLEKAAKEFFSGVESDLEAGIVSREDYLEDLHGPSKVKVSYRMKNKDFDEAANLAELETFSKYGDIWHTTLVSPLEKELEFNKQLLNHLDPRSQQYQDARYLVGYAQSTIDKRREEMYRGRDAINRAIETGTDTGSSFLKLKKMVEEFEEAEKKKAALGLY